MRSESTPQVPRHPAPAAHEPARSGPPQRQEDVQRFRKLMDGRGRHAQAEETGHGAAPLKPPAADPRELRELLQRAFGQAQTQAPVFGRREERGHDEDGQDDARRQNDSALTMAFGQAAQQAAPQAAASHAPAAQASMAPALAELIERHVKQLLVSELDGRSSAQSAREVMLTLKGDLLPATELWLSRTDEGWKLRADTRSAAAYRTLLEGAPALVARFAEGRLGKLEIDSALRT